MSRTSVVFSVQITTLLVSVCWFLWSFTQTDPNLYYSSTSYWVTFQQYMWQLPRVTVVWWYFAMIIVAFSLYLFAIAKRLQFPNFFFVLPAVLVMLSNNALSHDIYNYMFNAKAMVLYHQDPHVLSALEIAPHDEWVRFMHNVHTSAPYGHVWTYFTVAPFVLGLGKFLSTYIVFKAFMLLGLTLMSWIQWSLLEQKSRIWLFLLNPLVLIETLSSGHNDVWMMLLAFGGFALILKSTKFNSIQTVLSLVLILLSTQIKEATILLLPLWMILVIREGKSLPSWIVQIQSNIRDFWPEVAALLLFLPLLTERSQQFNPWYLMWSLSFLPFFRIKLVRDFFILLSVTSMLRYIPFLFVGGYSDAVQWQMRMITWSAVPIAGLWMLIRSHVFPYAKKR